MMVTVDDARQDPTILHLAIKLGCGQVVLAHKWLIELCAVTGQFNRRESGSESQAREALGSVSHVCNDSRPLQKAIGRTDT